MDRPPDDRRGANRFDRSPQRPGHPPQRPGHPPQGSGHPPVPPRGADRDRAGSAGPDERRSASPGRGSADRDRNDRDRRDRPGSASPDRERGNSPDRERGNSPDRERGNSPDRERGNSPDRSSSDSHDRQRSDRDRGPWRPNSRPGAGGGDWRDRGGPSRDHNDRGHSPHLTSPREHNGPPADWVTGIHAVLALVERAPQRVLQVILWSRDPRLCAQIHTVAAAKKVAVVEREPPAFDDPANPQGVAAQVVEFHYADLDAIAPPQGCADGTLLLVLDSITDPRNLGAILRSAAFFGVHGVIIPQDRAAGVTPVVERISRGATASVPVVRVVNLARTLQILQERGVFVVGTGLDASSIDLATYRFAPITALVLGAEGGGIRPLVRKRCDEVVKLSGSSDMQSLNVSAFATLALHLARAQR